MIGVPKLHMLSWTRYDDGRETNWQFMVCDQAPSWEQQREMVAKEVHENCWECENSDDVDYHLDHFEVEDIYCNQVFVADYDVAVFRKVGA